MNKGTIVALTSIALNIALLFVSIHVYYEQRPDIVETTLTAPTRTGDPLKVAIFEPAPHPAIEDISRGFRTTLEQQGKKPYIFSVYNANGNKTLQRSQAEEMVSNNFDLIFTIGTSCTQLIKELTAKKNLTTPVLFSAIDDPVGTGIVQSLESSGNNMTGIIEKVDYAQQIAALSIIKPSARSILLVYDPGHGAGLEKDKAAVQSLAASYGITVDAVPVYNAGELQQKVEGLIPGHDTVLVLKDNTVVSAIDSLVRLCNRYGVTLYVSDLNSGEKGAALAYGVTEAEFGVQAGKKALLILEEGKQPTTIPTTPLREFSLAINETTMHQQNLLLNPTMKFLLHATRFTGVSA